MTLDQITIADWLGRAKAAGLDGFGGRCAAAAIAINRVLFEGEALLIGGLNEAFLDCNQIVGHIAVCRDGVIWDADGRPKSEEDLEAWGMLDEQDPDYAERAAEAGFTWSTSTAQTATIFEFDDESELIDFFGADPISDMVALLEACGPQ